MKKQLNTLYLDYFNNFITLSAFAEHYNMNEDKALRVISIGRKINHSL